jgi:hypothetical protein
MSKIRRISGIQNEFSFFSPSENYQAYFDRFLQSDLGKIYQAIPWSELIKGFYLRDRKKGPLSTFSPRGKLALMFLKHYTGCSDRKMIEQLNGNIDYQLFCDIFLGHERLTNFKMVSAIRKDLANRLDIDRIESILASFWRPHISDKNSVVIDATCYESDLWYPTDQKLLWRAVEWSYHYLKRYTKQSGLLMPRTKFRKWKIRYVSYSKMRRKSRKKRRSLTRGLLRLLYKLIVCLANMEEESDLLFPERYYRRRAVIEKLYEQQASKFYQGQKIKDRIVSIHKEYVRPIVRGKEIKQVEFGAKVNKIMIDGISFIEHISFDAFNEGTRLIRTIFKAQRLMHCKVKVVGADAIYATNRNRKFVTKSQIFTDFKPKGRKHREHKQIKKVKQAITKERASRLEGSFGKDKENYYLKTIKAKTRQTEILWIFFGIHTANALEIGRRISAVDQLAA